mgnify:CR=1 FL=1
MAPVCTDVVMTMQQQQHEASRMEEVRSRKCLHSPVAGASSCGLYHAEFQSALTSPYIVEDLNLGQLKLGCPRRISRTESMI